MTKNKPLVDLSGNEYKYKQKGRDAPVYSIFAKDEKKAIKELTKLVSMFGLTFEDMERV